MPLYPTLEAARAGIYLIKYVSKGLVFNTILNAQHGNPHSCLTHNKPFCLKKIKNTIRLKIRTVEMKNSIRSCKRFSSDLPSL